MARILVVDDDGLVLTAMSRILEGEGHTILTHADPLKAAEERDFDVVISDFLMPNLNGIELLGVYKETVPDCVRLLLTAASDFKIALDAVNRGEVYRLLPKPWNVPELLSIVRQSVEFHRMRQENQRLARALEVKNQELQGVNQNLERLVVERTDGLLDGMIRALDYRDTETQWHSRRVSLFAKRIAEEVGIQGHDLITIEQGSLLHDIGKIGVRDSILLKPGPLTPEEWVEMKLHPEIGYRMLSNIGYLREASLIVYQHQERWDSRGYPQGLGTEHIVIGARIFSIADAMDAITSDRPYRKGSPLDVAKREIERCGGTQFDPNLVKAYLAIPDSEWLRIRQSVEQMEEDDNKRWQGKPLVNPVKAAFAQAISSRTG